MFDNVSNIECYKYDVDLSTSIEFFCTLLYDLGANMEKDFHVSKLFKDEFLERIGYRFSADENIDQPAILLEIAAAISDYVSADIINQIDLNRTGILFLYKPKKLIYCLNSVADKGKAIKTSITNLIKEKQFFNFLIDNVAFESLKGILGRLVVLKFNEHLSNIVKLTESKGGVLPYVPIEFLIEDLIQQDVIESEDVWISHSKFQSVFEIQIDPSQEPSISLVLDASKENENEIGVKYNSLIFLTASSVDDLKPLIKPEFFLDYFWFQMHFLFTKRLPRKSGGDSKELREFKAFIKEAELNKLLSFIQKNHYIQGIVVPAQFSHFFEEVSVVKKLDHIKDYDFYISSAKGKTALGIYTNTKIGKSFNLLHWIKDDDTEKGFEFFRSDASPTKQPQEKVLVLKPEIAFYFMSSYFEDFLETAVEELKLNYITNFEVFYNTDSLGEIDCVIKTDKKICFIEAKTKLTNDYIEGYLVKCSKILDALKPIEGILPIEFYIVSPYSDDSCKLKQYFINLNQVPGYNVEREGVRTVPYYFQVPIAQHNNALLTCIAEPEYETLKSLIEKICQK
ncbi:hypothetical protein AB6805_08335 [Chitinophaga sp. RCC_12]|uniref:hypothetical protein n=1 Tax=Chitinophaga sp. RCC_12 TaxID=3239226 RepID=UPI0035246DFB